MNGLPWYIHTLERVIGSKNCQSSFDGRRYVRAIPEPYTAGRIQAAWWVLTGRAYAFAWPKSGDLEKALNQ